MNKDYTVSYRWSSAIIIMAYITADDRGEALSIVSTWFRQLSVQ